jgi:hypothetical protein
MAVTQVVQLKPKAKALTKATQSRELSLRKRLTTGFACGMGAVAVAATALSLSDLAAAVQELAHISTWKAYALATTLDCNFICTEAFSLFCTLHVARATQRATLATKVVTLVLSAGANAFAMASTADGPIAKAACIAAGIAVPSLIALATATLGKAVRQ